MNKISVFITDDHSLFRNGVITALKEDPTFIITGEAESVLELLQSGMLENTDILLLDISLKEQSSLDSMPEITSRFPELKILILSMHNKPMLIKKAINLGISGYILKHSPPETLLHAVKEVQAGRKYLDPDLSDSIFTCLRNSGSGTEADALYNNLSAREQEIFRMLAEGLTPPQIAKQLFISRKTVDNHRSKIMSKLRIDSSARLIQLAEKLGVT
ncbi:MAG: response regulator transcription factor [Spirochaetales bacterium]|nr:response regulator transcription factor [Spirochaetales bacterium]